MFTKKGCDEVTMAHTFDHHPQVQLNICIKLEEIPLRLMYRQTGSRPENVMQYAAYYVF